MDNLLFHSKHRQGQKKTRRTKTKGNAKRNRETGKTRLGTMGAGEGFRLLRLIVFTSSEQ
jgi:hypothetical protein